MIWAAQDAAVGQRALPHCVREVAKPLGDVSKLPVAACSGGQLVLAALVPKRFPASPRQRSSSVLRPSPKRDAG
eukprot:431934-Lingulodinium_polyedra.AAC.1